MPKVIIPIIKGKKQCTACKKWKLMRLFGNHVIHQTGKRTQCKKCYAIVRKKYIRKAYERKSYKYKANPQRQWKLMVLTYYGNVCLCCKESNAKMLTVDHINDDGKQHKGNGKHRYKGEPLYRYLVKNKYPNGIQILCFNCNIGRRNNNGICPHKQ